MMPEEFIQHANPKGSLETIGKRLPRIDAGKRVTGEAIYPADMHLPGMAIAKLKRSPHAHAKILSIDTTKALALDGVLAVVTAEDFPDLEPGTSVPMGQGSCDVWMVGQINMARHKVLWVGQPVAAVAAVDKHIAEQALELIEVHYEVLDAVFTMEDAQAETAPILHDSIRTSGLDAPINKPSNICSRTIFERGDCDTGVTSSHAVTEVSVSIDTAHQGYIEPQAVVAKYDREGLTTMWVSTQGHFTAELVTAKILGIPQSKIRVIPLEIGGGFGGKVFVHGEPVAAKLSEKSSKPIKLVFSREEVLQGGSGPTAAMQAKVTVGANSDGRINTLIAKVHVDAGGLPNMSPAIILQVLAALYQTPNLFLEGYDVVTNKPRTEAYRAPGGIQAAFAMEQAIDQMSEKLDMDPLNFRKKNFAVTGSIMPAGTPFPCIGVQEIAEAIAKHPCWTTPLEPGEMPRGRGLAFGYWRGTSMTSACHVTISGDGRPMFTLGSVDISGSSTAMAQVAAEQFQMPLQDVYVATGDSKSVGYTDIAAASRVTRTMASAVVDASQKALDELKIRAATLIHRMPSELTYDHGSFRTADVGGPSISSAEVMQSTLTQGAIVCHGISTDLPFGVEVGAHVCDVEVDEDTGQITVLRYTAFQDVGLAINPAAVEGQIEGSVVQGLGWAITEGFDYGDDGRLRNASLLDYRIPTALDVPSIETVLLQKPVPGVPYGLRGVGEVPIVPVAACVANAVYRATGARMTQMPMTPERVLTAIQANKTN